MPKINYNLIRSSRKTLSIYIKESGVEVRAPLRMSKAEITGFVEQKRQWIENNLATIEARNTMKSTFEVNYGSRLPYRGTQYIVGGTVGKYVKFENAFCVPLYLTPYQIKRGCIQIYRLLAKHDIPEKVQQHAEQMNVKIGGDFHPLAIKINGAKTRWGSCSAKKSLNFSWRLMMADDEVIDYVVVHELAHIKEMNHSPAFWGIVERILPDYKQRQTKLKTLQKKLSAENWDE